MSQIILNYTANGALHHLLHGIKSLIAVNAEASCTWSQLQTWARLNPCAGTHANSRVKMPGSGLLMLSRLNIKRTAPTPKGGIAGRNADIHGVTSPFDRPPASRAGSEEFRQIPSRSGDQAQTYDSAQGIGRFA